jgi:hypothetical protein
MKRTFEEIADRILYDDHKMTDQPLYLSRSGLGPKAKRILLGEERFESYLRQQGFRIVRPETLPIPEQIGLFNSHRWIISLQGSACHARLFSRQPTNILVLSSELNPNYVLCDLVTEGTAHYANVLSQYDYLASGDIERPVLGQPLFMNEDFCLSLLGKLGLVASNATMQGERPDSTKYMEQWIATARKQALRTKDVRLMEALDRIDTSKRPF